MTAIARTDVDTASEQTLTGKTLTSPKVNQINDTGGAAAVVVAPVASAVNHLKVTGSGSGGSAATLESTGSDSTVALRLASKGSSAIALKPAGSNALVLYSAASAVNYLQVDSAAAGGSPVLSAVGSDANTFLTVKGKGVHGPILMSDIYNLLVCYRAVGNLNYFTLTGGATGVAPSLQATGETNTSFNLKTSGTGIVQANGNPVGVKVAVPASAGATGVPGQWAADANYIYACTATNTWVRCATDAW